MHLSRGNPQICCNSTGHGDFPLTQLLIVVPCSYCAFYAQSVGSDYSSVTWMEANERRGWQLCAIAPAWFEIAAETTVVEKVKVTIGGIVDEVTVTLVPQSCFHREIAWFDAAHILRTYIQYATLHCTIQVFYYTTLRRITSHYDTYTPYITIYYVTYIATLFTNPYHAITRHHTTLHYQ